MSPPIPLGGLVLGGGAPPTDPAGLPNCQLWLRGGLGVTTTAGAWAWADQSGHPQNSVSDLGHTSMDPSLIATDSDFGGRASIDFGTGGSNLGLGTTQGVFTGIAQPDTVYMVALFHNLTGTPVLMDCFDNGGNRQFLYAAAATWDMYAGSFLTGGTSGAGVAHVWAMVFDSTSSLLYVDSSASAIATGDAGTNNWGGSTLGDQYSIGGFDGTTQSPTQASYSSHAKIAEVVVYSGHHTSGNVHTVFAALAAYYSQSWT